MNNTTDVQVVLRFPQALVEKVVRGIMDNYPEASATLHCRQWDCEQCKYQFFDYETEKIYNLNLQALCNAFPLLFSHHWYESKGLTQPPACIELEAWDNWLCQADAGDFDAFVQLAIFGEIIYG